MEYKKQDKSALKPMFKNAKKVQKIRFWLFYANSGRLIPQL